MNQFNLDTIPGVQELSDAAAASYNGGFTVIAENVTLTAENITVNSNEVGSIDIGIDEIGIGQIV